MAGLPSVAVTGPTRSRMLLVQAGMLNSGWWPPDVPPTRSRQMRGEVLVHLEHGHLVLAEDSPELVIGHDFAAVLRVLQVMRADVLPDLAHHLAPGQRARADHRGQLLRQL